MDKNQAEALLEILGALDPCVIPIHHAQVLLFVGKKDSCTYREIEDEFKISNASASRIVNSLGENVRHRKKCLGLVEVFIDPKEGRRYRVRLTKKGHALMRTIDNI